MFNLPNILTLSRIAMLPVLMVFFFIPAPWAAWSALGIYTLAAITDFLDGYLARSMDQISSFGKFLDPISDKIFVATLLLILVGFDRLTGVWIIPAIVILMREFLVAGLREYLGPLNVQLPVSKLAKWKTTVQMVTLGFLIVGDYGDVILPHTLSYGQWGLALASILTLITGWDYLKTGLKHIK
ncbi:MAG: CDP-diacylglycerol--glycerol-3-phosphate 3-phosphatidyltransferase [Rhodospirillales bacterium]|nr:CDP-diacylglycerol--glycerol-3-phosphate 3-phosphatidyltransferase [Alphaproteobacteria bacterium]USO02925.1 MAG: CDP-diacylglycerol--glycerol-3-phosphate 3-phosphatidyltransferase [Rhodospirillales bacterium]